MGNEFTLKLILIVIIKILKNYIKKNNKINLINKDNNFIDKKL